MYEKISFIAAILPFIIDGRCTWRFLSRDIKSFKPAAKNIWLGKVNNGKGGMDTVDMYSRCTVRNACDVLVLIQICGKWRTWNDRVLNYLVCSVDGLLLCIKVFNEFNLLVYSIVHISSTAMNHFLKQKQMLCKKICWNLRDLNAIMSLNIDRSVYLVVTIDKNSNIVWQCINARNL